MNNSVILFDIKKNCWEECSRPMPELTIDESLVKVEFAGLCGSDMHRIKAPTSHETQIVMGHEIIGTVEKSDKETLIGKKVVINPIAHCGKCSYCNDGLTQFCFNYWGWNRWLSIYCGVESLISGNKNFVTRAS